MIGNKTRILVFSIKALLIIGISFSSCLKIEEIPSKEERVNLALRQIGDKLYRYCGDASTNIPPVETKSDIEFQLELDNGVEYDVLPEIMEKTFSDFGIDDQYIVSILDCEDQQILLGYNTVAMDSDFIACGGRQKKDGCNILNVKLYKSTAESRSSIPWLYMLLGGLGLLFLVLKSRTKKQTTISEEKDVVEQSPETEALDSSIFKIGNSIFNSKLLTINHADETKSLTYRESKLLTYFVNNKNEVLKREDIQSHVWEEEGVIVGRSLDVFISRLRKIIKSDTSLSIKNIHGVGYRLEENL